MGSTFIRVCLGHPGKLTHFVAWSLKVSDVWLLCGSGENDSFYVRCSAPVMFSGGLPRAGILFIIRWLLLSLMLIPLIYLMIRLRLPLDELFLQLVMFNDATMASDGFKAW